MAPRLASCTLLAHDGVINTLMRAYPVKLDAVGRIEIGNNVFIGNGATVLRGVRIGDNCVIAAGAMVVRALKSARPCESALTASRAVDLIAV